MKRLCAVLSLLAASGAAFAQYMPVRYTVSALSGSGQVLTLNTGSAVQFAPLVARVTDAVTRQPVSGLPVVFYCGPSKPPEMLCYLDPTGATSLTRYTASDGTVVLNRFHGASAVAAVATGTLPIIASSPDPRAAVVFDLTVAAPLPVSPSVSPPGVTH